MMHRWNLPDSRDGGTGTEVDPRVDYFVDGRPVWTVILPFRSKGTPRMLPLISKSYFPMGR